MFSNFCLNLIFIFKYKSVILKGREIEPYRQRRQIMAGEDSIKVKLEESKGLEELITEDMLVSTADNNKKHGKAALFSELSDYAAAVQSSSDDTSSSPSESDTSDDLFGVDGNNALFGVNEDDDGGSNGGSDDGDTDYDNTALLKKLEDEIAKLAAELKSGSLSDHMAELGQILNDLTSVFGNFVGQDADSQTAMSDYIAGDANVQKYLADQTGTADQDDINPYTGKVEIDPKTGQSKKVTASVALEHELSYLSNSPKTEYELNDDGTPKVDHVDPDGTKHYVKNPVYNFFKNPANKSLTDSLESNINTLVNSLTDGNYKPSMSGDPGYTIDPATGKVSGGAQITIPDGAIKNAWDKANSHDNPDPSIVKAMQSASGTLSSSYTSGSSAIQDLAKSDTQMYQTAQGGTNNFFMDWINLEKTMQKGQVSG